jgi:hypothetical protein
MEWEVKPLGAPFDGAATSGLSTDTGAPVVGLGSAAPLNELVIGLQPETPYHWRVRIGADSPFFPHSPWLSPPMNGETETDLRTGSALAAAPPRVVRGGLRLEAMRPNPFVSKTAIVYALPSPDRVVLAVYDVQGRRIASLANSVQETGTHSVVWEGRNQSGQETRPGVYWVRLEFRGEARNRILVRL